MVVLYYSAGISSRYFATTADSEHHDCNSLHKCCIKEEFKLELGGSLPELQIFYEQWGLESGPVVMIMPSLSSSSHARTSVSDPTPGWWEGTR